MNDEEIQSFVKEKLAQIFEHCDAVQILVSYNEDGLTNSFYTGAGNWYARQGMAHDFISLNQAETLAKTIHETEQE